MNNVTNLTLSIQKIVSHLNIIHHEKYSIEFKIYMTAVIEFTIMEIFNNISCDPIDKKINIDSIIKIINNNSELTLLLNKLLISESYKNIILLVAYDSDINALFCTINPAKKLTEESVLLINHIIDYLLNIFATIIPILKNVNNTSIISTNMLFTMLRIIFPNCLQKDAILSGNDVLMKYYNYKNNKKN